MSQLIVEGYISVSDEGTVIMNDPYVVYNNKREEILNEMREEWKEQINLVHEVEDFSKSYNLISLEKNIDKQIAPVVDLTSESKIQDTKSKQKKDISPIVIIESWNRCKPESYSSLRSLSIKQKECIAKHMKNLSLPPSETESFICAVCAGLSRSTFWSKQIDQKGRNFNSVFGYGNPQDVKMKNIENLYHSGSEEEFIPERQSAKSYTIDQQDTIDAYRFVSLNLEQSKARGDTSEIERWTDIMNTTLLELEKYQVNVEEL